MDENYLLILILVIFFIIILILAMLALLRRYMRKNQPQLTEPNVGWSDVSTTGTCQGYEFTSSFTGGVYIGPQPTYNSSVLNNIPPVTYTDTNTCQDFDTIYAYAGSHQCTNLPVGLTGSTLFCINQSGDYVKYGTTENIFISCVQGQDTGVLPCPGDLSIISIGYSTDRTYCLSTNSDGTITTDNCDPSDTAQMIRITRTTDPETQPSSTTQSGLLTQVYNRYLDKCLDIDFSTTGSVEMDYSEMSMCDSTDTDTVTGYQLYWNECGATGNYDNGYFWYTVESSTVTNTLNQQLVYVANNNNTLSTTLNTDLVNDLTSAYSIYSGEVGTSPVAIQRSTFQPDECQTLFSTYQPFNLQNISNFNTVFNVDNTCNYVPEFAVTTNCLTSQT